MHAAFLTEAGARSHIPQVSQATQSLQDGQVYCLGRNSYGECADPDFLFIAICFVGSSLYRIVRLCPTCGSLLIMTIMMTVFVDLSICSKEYSPYVDLRCGVDPSVQNMASSCRRVRTFASLVCCISRDCRVTSDQHLRLHYAPFVHLLVPFCSSMLLSLQNVHHTHT